MQIRNSNQRPEEKKITQKNRVKNWKGWKDDGLCGRSDVFTFPHFLAEMHGIEVSLSFILYFNTFFLLIECFSGSFSNVAPILDFFHLCCGRYRYIGAAVVAYTYLHAMMYSISICIRRQYSLIPDVLKQIL